MRVPLALAAIAALAVFTTARAQSTPSPASQIAQQPGGGPPRPQRPLPRPTNLQVLPKDISPEQLRDIMRAYSRALGVHCEQCHVQDAATHKTNFADDSKPEKAKARVMIAMTNDINAKYVAQLKDADQKASCAMCHRGHQMPEEFVPPQQQRPEPISTPAAAPGASAPPAKQ